MYSQPDGRFVGRCPLDTVLLMRRDIHEIAGFQFDDAIFKTKSRRASQHHNPFMRSWSYQNPSGVE